jgi:hypothetical protein
MTNSEKIRVLLRDRPHWGPMRVAEAMGTTPKNVSVTACTNGIVFMARRDLEDYVDALLERIAGLEVAHGKAQ